MSFNLFNKSSAPSQPVTVAQGGTGATSAAAGFSGLGGVTANQLSVFAAGTVYTVTNGAALVDFGTTDPTLVITAAGTYLIQAKARFENVGATFVASRLLTLKLRRTNNTAADLTNGTVTFNTPIITTLTSTLVGLAINVLYTTTNADDSISLFTLLNTVPSAGSVTVDEASIVAIRLQQ